MEKREIVERGLTATAVAVPESVGKRHVSEVVDGRAEAAEKVAEGELRARDPRIWAAYLQLAFNASLLLVALFLVFEFIVTVRNDVKHKLRAQMVASLTRIGKCQKNYDDNGCLPDTMVPALDRLCDEWLHCMQQDSRELHLYQSGRLWAETLAEILNSFVEPISLRSILVIVSSACVLVMVTNVAFRFYPVHYF